MYYEFQQQIYQNKLNRNFNVTDVQKEITLLTEEFGELCDAFIQSNNPEIVDAIGDMSVYCLGLSAMFQQNADNVINRCIQLPIKNDLASYICYFGREIGMLAKTYKKSNKKLVDEIDRREDFLKHIGNVMGYCDQAFRCINQDPVCVLELIIKNNASRTHQGKI